MRSDPLPGHDSSSTQGNGARVGDASGSESNELVAPASSFASSYPRRVRVTWPWSCVRCPAGLRRILQVPCSHATTIKIDLLNQYVNILRPAAPSCFGRAVAWARSGGPRGPAATTPSAAGSSPGRSPCWWGVPGHDPLREDVDDERDVDPSGPRAAVGEVLCRPSEYADVTGDGAGQERC